MTIPLPTEVKTGRVLGQQIVVGVDTSADADLLPDAAFPVGATITFEPTVPLLNFPVQHQTVYLAPDSGAIAAVIGDDGQPKTPDGDDLYLPANIGQTDNDQDWYWKVTIRVGGGRITAFRFDVTADADNYLTDQLPIPATTPSSAVVRGPAGAGAPPSGTPDGSVAVSQSEQAAWQSPDAAGLLTETAAAGMYLSMTSAQSPTDGGAQARANIGAVSTDDALALAIALGG